jgi:poly(A) polymerase
MLEQRLEHGPQSAEQARALLLDWWSQQPERAAAD